MQEFLKLYQAIERTNSTARKTEALAQYFTVAPPAEAIWVIQLILGVKQKRAVSRRTIEEALLALTGLPDWLFTECYASVGDLAETIALLVPLVKVCQPCPPLPVWMAQKLPELAKAEPEHQRDLLIQWWQAYDRHELFILGKLMTGGLRFGVAKNLLIRALAQAFGTSVERVAEQMMGDVHWDPSWFDSLSHEGPETRVRTTPLPFFLASPLDLEPDKLPPAQSFAIEWKWDGIRAQLVKRGGQIALWSRGEECLNDSFPDILAAAQTLPDGTVLDGELLIEVAGSIQSFAVLQKRIMRKKLSRAILEQHPALFLAFDCLEQHGADLREQPLRLRRERLEHTLREAGPTFRASPLMTAQNWEAIAALREEAAERKVEGLMLKDWESSYKIGRKRGSWWKWKLDPMSLDAVLLYAQAGHGRRSSQFTDYTFGLWKDGVLVPFAKAYSGLDQKEITELDQWIRAHTVQRFGPVRSVEPLRVFEIAFEGIQLSPRHKSGIAVRFPRILRERTDKSPELANTLEQALELLHARSH